MHSSSPPAASDAAAAEAEADLSSALSLANIRQTLIRLEDTIIFSLIERAQFARNEPVYEAGAIPVPGFHATGSRYSLLEYLLREIEQVGAASCARLTIRLSGWEAGLHVAVVHIAIPNCQCSRQTALERGLGIASAVVPL